MEKEFPPPVLDCTKGREVYPRMYWRYELIPPTPTKTITRLLFVGYAGIPMERCLNEPNEDIIAQGTEGCLTAIHALGVLHTDAFCE